MFRRRRKSEPVYYESDENELEDLDYNEDSCYGWNEDVPAPVQVKRPDRRSKRPGDRLHRAVWNDNPNKMQKLVLNEGTYSLHSLYFT